MQPSATEKKGRAMLRVFSVSAWFQAQAKVDNESVRLTNKKCQCAMSGGKGEDEGEKQ